MLKGYRKFKVENITEKSIKIISNSICNYKCKATLNWREGLTEA